MTTLTMAQAVWPHRETTKTAAWTRDTILVIAFSLLTALSAQLSIHLPFTPVPITGQTFAVLLTGALLGPRLAVASMTLYLAEGFVGLPVFAGGVGTLRAILLSASLGYLLSYPFAAALVGWLATRGWDRRPATMLAAMALGSLVIYAGGVAWFAHCPSPPHGAPFGLRTAITEGMTPFLPGDALKALLAAGLLPMGWKWIGRRRA